MATKPRHKKTETQLWVYDNAKRLGLTDVDLARATGVEPGTARSWFSRGKPNADAVPILERLFGRPAPEEQDAPTVGADLSALVAALNAQTEAINGLLARFDSLAGEAIRRGVAAALAEAAALQGGGGSQPEQHSQQTG